MKHTIDVFTARKKSFEEPLTHPSLRRKVDFHGDLGKRKKPEDILVLCVYFSVFLNGGNNAGYKFNFFIFHIYQHGGQTH